MYHTPEIEANHRAAVWMKLFRLLWLPPIHNQIFHAPTFPLLGPSLQSVAGLLKDVLHLATAHLCIKLQEEISWKHSWLDAEFCSAFDFVRFPPLLAFVGKRVIEHERKFPSLLSTHSLNFCVFSILRLTYVLLFFTFPGLSIHWVVCQIDGNATAPGYAKNMAK